MNGNQIRPMTKIIDKKSGPDILNFEGLWDNRYDRGRYGTCPSTSPLRVIYYHELSRFYKLSEEDGEVSTGSKILARKEEGKLT